MRAGKGAEKLRKIPYRAGGKGAEKGEKMEKKIKIVFWNIGVEGPITPAAPLPELPEIPRGAVLVVGGRAPIWRYGMAFHAVHGSPAATVAVFDPRLGAVVVASHDPEYREGEVLNVEWPF